MSQNNQQQHFFAEMDVPDTPLRLAVPPSQFEALSKTSIDYVDDFITPQEEEILLAALDNQCWINDLSRRVQHYGYRYDYKARSINKDDHIGDLPEWVLPFAERLVAHEVFTACPDQLIINEYEAGQGIAAHTDRDCFGPVIAAISLGSDCMMRMDLPNADKKTAFDVVVLRRSLMVYRGVGRTHYRHSLQPRKTDKQNGHVIPRGRRVSLTFRTLR